MNKSEWGNAVWLLFHTIACKIDENYLVNNKDEVIQFIRNVCHNLPCPTCAEHARETINKANLNNIETKENLKYFFWSFHNIVNERLEKIVVPYEYIELYERAVTHNVIINFKQKFYKRAYNDKLLIQSFQFARNKTEINNFLDNLLVNNRIKR